MQQYKPLFVCLFVYFCVFVMAYFSCSNQIEGHVTGKTEVEALNPYMELCEVCLALQPSGCVHLKEWAVAVQSHWKQVLNECLSR